MSQEPTVPVILNLAKICEYLALNSISKNNYFSGGDLDERLGRMIYAERKAVQLRYTLNPNDSTLQNTANYLLSLLCKFQLQAQVILQGLAVSPPLIVGPSSVSVGVGQNATFGVTVTSSTPFTGQWFDSGGNPIIGATSTTFTFNNAQLGDNGKTFFYRATNTAGTTTSAVATLIVTAVITGFFSFDPSTDYYPILLTNSDPFTYQASFTITHNQPATITLPPAMPANQFMLVKIPISETVKTSWFNTNLNNGSVPDSVFQSVVQFGGFSYYATRNQVSMDVTQTLVLS